MPYTFSLPSIAALSQGQKIALNAESKDVFILSGCPGSGKTTVALLRAKGKGSDPRFHFTVWAQMLYGYLLGLSGQLEVGESYFSTFHSWFMRKFRIKTFDSKGINIEGIVSTLQEQGILFDEFQLDEGQDLPVEVRSALSLITRKLVICMDEAQDVTGASSGIGRAIDDTIDTLKRKVREHQNIFF